jgi:hypothetical protein
MGQDLTQGYSPWVPVSCYARRPKGQNGSQLLAKPGTGTGLASALGAWRAWGAVDEVFTRSLRGWCGHILVLDEDGGTAEWLSGGEL